MRIKAEKRKVIVVSLLFVALIFAAVFCSSDIAYALLPPNYQSGVIDKGYEWWSTEDILDLETVKTVVDGWFGKENEEWYDFTSIDENPIVVAVIDSGVDINHETFTGIYETGTGATPRGEYDVLYRENSGKVIGFNSVNNSDDVADVATGGHGTHVAGIVATLIHWLGLEKYIKIMPIMAGKSASNGGATFRASDVKEAVEFALDNNADVINMSLESQDNAFNDIVLPKYAEQAIFVAAAGNTSKGGVDSAESGGKRYPAANDNVIGVMNVSNQHTSTGELQLAASSNYGPSYDICAPGTAIYSAGLKDNNYVSKTGTSMAAPIVSFASALALLKNRAIYNATGIGKTVPEVKDTVTSAYTDHVIKGKYKLKMLDLKEIVARENNTYARIVLSEADRLQTLGGVHEAHASLKVVPGELQGTGRVEWFLEEEKIGEGFEIDIPISNEAGRYNISATWSVTEGDETKTYRSSEIVVVNYARVTSDSLKKMEIILDGSVKGYNSAPYKAGKKYLIVAKGVENIDPRVADNIKWYVNDALVHVGSDFTFAPDAPGKYEIYFKIDARLSNKYVIDIFEQPAASREAIIYVSIGVGCLIAIFVVAITIAIVVRRRKHAAESEGTDSGK